MIDENAFGLLLAHYDLESIEYSLEEPAFLEYLERFVSTVEGRLEADPLARDVRRLDLGHAVYLEFADGEQLADPILWVRSMRQALVEADLPNVCVLSAGGRWIPNSADERDDDGGTESDDALSDAPESGAWRVSTPAERDISNPLTSPAPLVDDRPRPVGLPALGPSEPLRKALAAEAFAQPTLSGDGDHGWGPGLYVEKDAIEQLGKTLKNAPTALSTLSATFYRLGV